MKTKAIQTPDSRFVDLPDYPFEPNYLSIDNLRLHYVDTGPKSGPVALLMHGEPSWSYLYRKMIPIFAEAGFRTIAPDLIGFGKSDKPTNIKAYSYQTHVDWITRFIEELNLTDINLVCQDWGSLIGLRVAAENSDRFARIALGNGGLPDGSIEMPRAFLAWQKFAKHSPWFPIGKLVAKGCTSELTPDVIKAYDAPFPSRKYKKGARAFPLLVPTSPTDPAAPAVRAAWEVFKRWDKPFLTCFSDRDPITKGGAKMWQETVPGAKGQPHVTIKGAGHFLQEDKGPEMAEAIVRFIEKS
ncbi:MAG: haloalkane dehalogenase [Pseudomonadota bacterium]